MNIVFISTDKSLLLNNNGDSFARHLEYAKHIDRVVVIVFTNVTDNFEVRVKGNLTIVPTNSPNRWFYVVDALKILAINRDFDVISTQDPFITAFVGIVSKIIWGIKFNIQIHNDFFTSHYFREESIQNFLFYLLGLCTLKYVDSVRVVSGKLYQSRNVFVAPVPVDLEYFKKKAIQRRSHTIVTVARLVKQKNLPLLIESAVALAKVYKDLRLIIIGEGPEREHLVNLIFERNLARVVSLTGQKSRREIKSIFNKADVYVQSSNYEGWGLSIIEAISSGLPVVMTNTGCANEIVVSDEVSGIVINPGDNDGLSRAIEYLFTNRVIAQKLVQKGQRLLKKDFPKEKLTKDLVKGYEKALIS